MLLIHLIVIEYKQSKANKNVLLEDRYAHK